MSCYAVTIPAGTADRGAESRPAMSVEIAGEALDVLNELSARRGLSMGHLLAEAIGFEKAINEAVVRGGRVVIERDGPKRELTLVEDWRP